jgi:hypothetical protein
MQKVHYLKTLLVFVLLLLVLGYVLYPYIFKNRQELEAYTTLKDYFLVDNIHLFDETKAINSRKCKSMSTLAHTGIKNLNLVSKSEHPDSSSATDNDIINNKKVLVALDVRKLGYINRNVQIKHGSLCLMVNKNGNLEFRNLKLDINGYQSSTFKVLLGLHGPDTVSFYHTATDSFISRDANGKLFLINIELVNELVKRTASYKLCYGLDNINNIAIVCPMINKESSPRVWQLTKSVLDIKNVPRMVKYNELNNSDYNACDFYLQDVESGVRLGTNYNSELSNMDRRYQLIGDIEPFESGSSSNYESSRLRNMRDKRNVTSLVNEGLLSEFNKTFLNVTKDTMGIETFESTVPNSNDTSNNASSNNDNGENTENLIKGYNVFGSHTGKEFNDILNYSTLDKNYSQLLDDNLVKKLQASKLDPSVQSLLDYNEKYYNVYKQENYDYESKLNSLLDNHISNVDTNIRKANNYRVGEMAKQLFNAESILAEKSKL